MTDKKPLNLKLKDNTVTHSKKSSRLPAWRILVVDDDIDVHAVTRLILSNIVFKQRSIELLSAYSANEARQLLSTEKNIAIVLLDVVMETEDAGLRLVQIIRNELNNHDVRIILRTGQPGQAPEERVVIDYDINDYKAKSELTAQKLFTSVIAALRAYETITTLNKNKLGLEKILHSADSLFKIQSMQEFASGILTQLSSFLGCQPRGIICVQGEVNNEITDTTDLKPFHVKVIAATDEFECCLHCHLDDCCQCNHHRIVNLIRKTLLENKSQFNDEYSVFYLDAAHNNKATIALVCSEATIDESDRYLLKVFTSKISIALANALHYQRMISFEKASTTDFLTGLCNRRQLLRLGLALLTNAHRTGVPLIVAMLDVDFFKQINDTYGHDVGDSVLEKVSVLLQERFRRHTDVIARYGGEEFCILVSNLKADEALALFESFRIAIANSSINVAGNQLNITVSIGVATELCQSLDDMISAADHLMYQAKQTGRNRVVIDIDP